MYSEYYEPIDFPSDFKTQNELDVALAAALRSNAFVARFAGDSNRCGFLRWDGTTGHKIDYQKSHYLHMNDIRFNFNIDVRDGSVSVEENENDDGSSEIGNPGDSLEYLSMIISQVIAKSGRTCLISNAENENYGYAVKRDSILTLDFSAYVKLGKGKKPVPLTVWLTKKEKKQ